MIGVLSLFGFSRKNEGEQPDRIDAVSDHAQHPSKQVNLAGRVVIRVIDGKDKEPARAHLKQHHASTNLAEYPFSDRKYDEHAKKIYARPDNMICFVAELDGAIVGLLWASAGSYALSDDLVLTTCHIIAIDQQQLSPRKRIRTFMRLIKAVKTWSDTRGCNQVLIHVTTGTNLKATDRMLRRSGATCIGGGYVD